MEVAQKVTSVFLVKLSSVENFTKIVEKYTNFGG